MGFINHLITGGPHIVIITPQISGLVPHLSHAHLLLPLPQRAALLGRQPGPAPPPRGEGAVYGGGRRGRREAQGPTVVTGPGDEWDENLWKTMGKPWENLGELGENGWKSLNKKNEAHLMERGSSDLGVIWRKNKEKNLKKKTWVGVCSWEVMFWAKNVANIINEGEYAGKWWKSGNSIQFGKGNWSHKGKEIEMTLSCKGEVWSLKLWNLQTMFGNDDSDGVEKYGNLSSYT